MKTFLFLFLSIHLSGCFILPRVKILRALKKKDCSKLSSSFFYDLSAKQLKRAASICFKKKEYKKTLLFLDRLEEQEPELEKKTKFWRQKASIYMQNLFEYPKAIEELEKLLKYEKEDYSIWRLLIKSRIKNRSLDRALEDVHRLLSQNLKPQQRLAARFTKARLLLLLGTREESLKEFQAIKKEDEAFFRKNQGPFYKALLLEEEKRFLEAIEELSESQWSFADEKNEHWIRRDKNAPKSR